MDLNGIILLFCVVGGFVVLTCGIKRICRTYLDKYRNREKMKNDGNLMED